MASVSALDRPLAGAARRLSRPASRHGWRALQAAGVLAVLLVPEHPGSPASFDLASAPLRDLATERTGSAPDSPETLTAASLPLESASPFVASYGDGASPGRAETCLAEAIYYEGALEPEAGQRAIAQVVLNRVRHPAYPDTVCGVVFEGQQRVTGCQFTFTCDGSRARRPVPGLWARAERVAKAALGGQVAKEVGLATHYHADYVSPYWSATLEPAGKIGRHIFYRWRGDAGRADAFSARYAGREPQIEAFAPRPAATETAAADGVPSFVPGAEGIAAASSVESAPAPAAPTRFTARPLRLATAQDSAR